MTKTINVFTENIYPDWELDEAAVIANTRKIVEFYLGFGVCCHPEALAEGSSGAFVEVEDSSPASQALNDGVVETLKQVQGDKGALLESSCLEGIEFDTLTFDILFCDGAKTHQINKEYRDKDYVADIITFAIFADDESKFVLDGDVNLGEIIIALDKIREEAKKIGVSEGYELYFLIAHGILHLLGFDHQSEEDYNFVVGVQKKALLYAGVTERHSERSEESFEEDSSGAAHPLNDEYTQACKNGDGMPEE